MKFDKVIIESAKADLAKRAIKLTFTVPLDEQATAEELMEYKGEACTLQVLPRQMQFATELRAVVGGRTIRADSVTGEVIPGDEER